MIYTKVLNSIIVSIPIRIICFLNSHRRIPRHRIDCCGAGQERSGGVEGYGVFFALGFGEDGHCAVCGVVCAVCDEDFAERYNLVALKVCEEGVVFVLDDGEAVGFEGEGEGGFPGICRENYVLLHACESWGIDEACACAEHFIICNLIVCDKRIAQGEDACYYGYHFNSMRTESCYL